MLGLEDDDDIDIFSKDETLMNFYHEQNGPENETIYQFYSRSYQKLCNRIVAPEKFKYDSKVDLSLEAYSHDEYDVYARGRTLHMCHWSPKNLAKGPIAKEEETLQPQESHICIVYCHTNMRSLVDAKEVAPLATTINAHIVSFDLPGCGKSEGQLGGNLELDIEIILDWVQALIDPSVRIVLWGRGMSTAPVITLLRKFCLAQYQQQQLQNTKLPTASSNNSLPSLFSTSESNKLSTSSMSGSKKSSNQPKTLDDFRIVGTILDSPFTSIEDMVQHGLEQFQGHGFSFTKTLLSFLIHRTLTHISKQLQGFNLFSVRPIEEVGDIVCPVCILSASYDDYVPVKQGQQIAAGWASRVLLSSFPTQPNGPAIHQQTLGEKRQGLVEFHIFEDVSCKHFDPRPTSVVSLVKSFLERHIAASNDHLLGAVDSAGSIVLLGSGTPVSAPARATQIGDLIAEGAAVSDSEIMDLAELENIANAIDAEVSLKQQQQQQQQYHSSAYMSTTAAATATTSSTTSSATRLSFSSSTSSLHTMATSMRQNSWWSFSGRFTSSQTTINNNNNNSNNVSQAPSANNTNSIN